MPGERDGMSCYLMYSVNGCRWGKHGTLQSLRAFVAAVHPTSWSIYREWLNGDRFHNSTDARYLVEHNSPYWKRREMIDS